MVGAPISFSGNQPQHPAAIGTNQIYATPGAPISTLLPYDGQAPSPAFGSPAPYPPATSGPFNTHMNMPTSSTSINTNYLYPPNPPTSVPYPPTSPPPFPPCSTATPNPYPPSSMAPSPNYSFNSTNAYPPTSSPYPNTNYPPNSGLNQSSPAYPPTGCPPQPNNHQAPIGYPTGQPTGQYPPSASTYPQANPTSYPPTPGVYPMPPSTGGVYPPRY